MWSSFYNNCSNVGKSQKPSNYLASDEFDDQREEQGLNQKIDKMCICGPWDNFWKLEHLKRDIFTRKRKKIKKKRARQIKSRDDKAKQPYNFVNKKPLQIMLK